MDIGFSSTPLVNSLVQHGFALWRRLYAGRREIGFAAKGNGRDAGCETRRAPRAQAKRNATALGRSDRDTLRSRERAGAFTPAVGARDVVCPFTACTDRRRLLVRHRRPSDVDG